MTNRTARLGATAVWTFLSIGCQKPAPQAQDSTATPNAVVVADTSSPAAVIRRYYAAIDARDYAAAYALWGQRGVASGQTRGQFAAGFTRTGQVRVSIGDSIRIEGAAGSQYATVPVIVDAVLQSGERQHFAGSYTLRRAMVDGATADERRWHIESARLHGA